MKISQWREQLPASRILPSNLRNAFKRRIRENNADAPDETGWFVGGGGGGYPASVVPS
jgi:hypothetical protein